MHFQNTRGGEAAHQRLTHASGIGSGFRRENQRLGHCFNIQRDDNLIGDFTGLTVAITAYEGDVLPRISNSGFTRAKTFSSPPTIIESVPSRAPISPPDTGASR